MSNLKQHLLSTGKSTATVALIESHVYDFCNWCEDERIEAQQATYNEILSYMQRLQKRGLKQSSIQKHIGSLKHYFTWLIAEDIRDTLPTEGIAVKNVQRRFLYHIIPMPELEKLYEPLGRTDELPKELYPAWKRQEWFNHKARKVVYGLMIWQGMNTSEIGRLTLNDLKLREGKIDIAGTRKSNERTLKLESVQIMDLMEYLHVIRPEYLRTNADQSQKDHLFIARNGGEWGLNFAAYLMKSITALHPRLTSFKQLHASVITYWLKNHNLRQVQHMAGHRYVSSTEAYLVNDLDDLQEDITKFHPMS